MFHRITDPTGRYMSLYKKWHLIGLELGVSVASVGLRQEATGAAITFKGDVAAIAKRDLKPGEMLDGEGGYTVSGGLRPAVVSIAQQYLPLGLAHKVKLVRPVKEGTAVTYADVEIDTTSAAYRLRKQMEKMYG